MPLGSGVMVDRKRLLDLVDELRVAVPEVGPGAALTERREEGPPATQRGDRRAAGAPSELEDRIAEQEVVHQAQARGEEILQRAEERARQIVQEAEDRAATDLARSATAAHQQLEEADHYALELLRKLEGQIQAFLDNVRASVSQIEAKQG